MKYLFFVFLLISCGKTENAIIDQLSANEAKLNRLQERIKSAENDIRNLNETIKAQQEIIDTTKSELYAYAEKANQAFNAIEIRQEEIKKERQQKSKTNKRKHLQTPSQRIR